MVWLLSCKSTTIVQCDHEMTVEFSTLHGGSRATSEIEILDFRRDNFSLLRIFLEESHGNRPCGEQGSKRADQ